MINVKDINPDKLLDELITSGIKVISLSHDKESGNQIAKNSWITFEDGYDVELANAVIEKHDPTPLPSSLTEMELLKEELANTNSTLLEMMELLLGGI